MANPVTGRESLTSILSGFDKVTKRLNVFIDQQKADEEKASAKIDEAIAARAAATANIERASRTRDKIAELIG